MKKISRREFFKSLGGLAAVSDERKRNTDESRTDAGWVRPDLRRGKEVATVCCECDRGCGVLLTVRDGKVIGYEGDPDHPANEGFLCEDAETLFELYTSSGLHPEKWMPELLHRPAGADAWEVGDWGNVLRSIARRVKETRDVFFNTKLRQAQGIGCIFDHAGLNNEETYLLYKLFKALGVEAGQTGSGQPGVLTFMDHLKAAGENLFMSWYDSVAGGGAAADHWLPKPEEVDISGRLQESIFNGLFIWGGGSLPEEPAGKVLRSIGSLDWLVYVNWFRSEETFLEEREKIAMACPRSEIFILPAAAPWEKTGSLASGGHWVQWCTEAVGPRGQARVPLWIMDRLYRELCEQYRGDGLFPEPILNLSWDYTGDTLPDVKMVAHEINRDSSSNNGFLGGPTVPPFSGYWTETEIPSMRRGFGGEWGFKLLR
ncbi:MAG: hypothetical protein AB1500_06400 [Bacillota bacterium]